MRSAAKRCADVLALLLVFPAALMYRVSGRILGAERVFPGWSQALALIPGLSGIWLRRAFYRLVLPRCGPDASIGFGTIFSRPAARIGRGVSTGVYCVLGHVVLEDDALLASHVSITSGSHQHGTDRLDIPVRLQPGVFRQVTVGRDTWVGERAVVMADVGQHCVIGAGAVVTHFVPDYAIVVGNPAQVVGFRNHPVEGRAS